MPLAEAAKELEGEGRGSRVARFVRHVAAAALDYQTGLPVGSAVEAFLALTKRNTAEAWSAFAAELEANRVRFDALEERINRREVDAEQLHRRLTTSQRTIHEAGRHPDRCVREALGTFAARVLITEAEQVELFEASEALARMTSADFQVLRLIGAATILRVGYVRVMDGKNSLVEFRTRERGGLSLIALGDLIPVVLGDLPGGRLVALDRRLQALQLTAVLRPEYDDSMDHTLERYGQRQLGPRRLRTDSGDSRQLTPLGATVLRLTCAEEFGNDQALAVMREALAGVSTHGPSLKDPAEPQAAPSPPK